MNKTNLVLVGGGGHCHSVIESIERIDKYQIVGISELPSRMGQLVNGYEIIVADDGIQSLSFENLQFLVTIGQIKSPAARIRAYELIKKHKLSLATIIDINTSVSNRAEIGEGTVVLRNSFINSGVSIGVNCIINTGAIVEHDSKIGNHVHISTGAIVNGDCTISDGCFIGSGAIISNGLTICPMTLVGAGSVVFKDITIAGTYIGNPARRVI